MHQNVQYQPRICYIIQPKSFGAFTSWKVGFSLLKLGKLVLLIHLMFYNEHKICCILQHLVL